MSSSIPPARPGLVLHYVPHPNDPNTKSGAPPHKYNREVHADIVRFLLAGHAPDNVAKAVGLSPSTFWKWYRAGESGNPWLFDFHKDCASAMGCSLMAHEKMVLDHAKEDPKFALNVLERRDPKQWGKVNQNQQVAEVMRNFLALCEAHFPPEVYDDILALAAGEGSTTGALGPATEGTAADE